MRAGFYFFKFGEIWNSARRGYYKEEEEEEEEEEDKTFYLKSFTKFNAS